MVESVSTADFKWPSRSDTLLVLDSRSFVRRSLHAVISLIEPGAVGVPFLSGITGLVQVLTATTFTPWVEVAIVALPPAAHSVETR
jgi:hypothetical protein